jgi:hypothetical protein
MNAKKKRWVKLCNVLLVCTLIVCVYFLYQKRHTSYDDHSNLNLNAGFLAIARTKEPVGIIPENTTCIIAFESPSELGINKRILRIEAIYDESTNAFQDTGKVLSFPPILATANQLYLLNAEELGSVFKKSGFFTDDHILSVRNKPFLYENRSGIPLSHLRIKLGDPGTTVLTARSLFYGNSAIKFIAGDFASGKWSESELIYSVEDNQGEQKFIVHDFIKHNYEDFNQ